MRVALITVLGFFLYHYTAAQTINLHGNITDKQGKPLAFTSLWISEAHTGASANEQGYYSTDLKPGVYTITFRKPGFEPSTQTIRVNNTALENNLTLNLVTGQKLPDNSADSIMRLVIANRKAYSANLRAYQGQLYCKSEQQLDGAPKTFMKKDIAHKLHMSDDHKGIISLSESVAEFHSRSTDYIKEDVSAAKLTIDSNAFGFNSAAELHIDLYKNTLLLRGLSDHAFLSPIADNALHYYRYNLLGKFNDGDRLVYAIRVTPRHKRNEHLFTGIIYIIDKDWLLYSADLHLTRFGHIDFIDSVAIRQQFVPTGDGNWISQNTIFRFYGKLIGFKYSGYFLQLYQSINADTSSDFGSGREVYNSNKGDYHKSNLFWQQSRAIPLLPDETNFYGLAEQAERHRKDKTTTDSLQNTNNTFRLIPYLFNGYTLHDYRNNSFWAFPSPYNWVFYNTVEGWGINLNAKFKKIYSNEHSLTVVPDIRYGFSDKALNANIFANYVTNPFKQASVYGSFGSDFLDLNSKGTISPFINSLSTLLLGNNYIKLYQSKYIMGGTDGEITNGILLNGNLEYAERYPLSNSTLHTFNKDSVKLTSNNPLDPNGDMALFPPYRALVFQGSATFTFDQKYKITPAGKFILPNPYPRLRFNYRQGIPAFGSDVNYVFTSVDVFQDKVNMGIYGFTSYFLSSGFFPSAKSLYYPDYQQFSGGESFFFDAYVGSFHFLNYYTYSTTKPYFEAHVEHNFAGYFLSNVPLLNRLNLQEIIGGSFLTQGTLPDYKEVYIGLKRTVIRLDYGLAYGRFTSIHQGFRFSYNF